MPRELSERAQGSVWNITTDGERPDSGLTIVATLQLQSGMQYRVLGKPSPALHPQPVKPSLEDGYLWLMQAQSTK